jgi:hypothetical protein
MRVSQTESDPINVIDYSRKYVKENYSPVFFSQKNGDRKRAQYMLRSPMNQEF